MAAQLSMKSALSLAKILATASCRSSKTGPRTALYFRMHVDLSHDWIIFKFVPFLVIWIASNFLFNLASSESRNSQGLCTRYTSPHVCIQLCSYISAPNGLIKVRILLCPIFPVTVITGIPSVDRKLFQMEDKKAFSQTARFWTLRHV